MSEVIMIILTVCTIQGGRVHTDAQFHQEQACRQKLITCLHMERNNYEGVLPKQLLECLAGKALPKGVKK